MKKTVLLLLVSTVLMSMLTVGVNAAVDYQIGSGKNTYTISVFTTDEDGAGTDADVTYDFDFAVGDNKILKNPKTTCSNRYERGQNDTFVYHTDGAMLSALTISCNRSGSRPDWKIEKVIIESKVISPKGKGIYDYVTFEVDKWMSDMNCNITLVPAKAGGLYYDKTTASLYFEHTDTTNRVTSEGIYRVLNYNDYFAGKAEFCELELVYDFTPASQTIFNLAELPHTPEYCSEGRTKLVKVSYNFAGGNIEFLNIQTKNAQIDSSVLNGGTLTTVGFIGNNLNTINVGIESLSVQNVVINDCESIPSWLSSGLTNLKSVYLYTKSSNSNIRDYANVFNSFNSGVYFYFGNDGANFIREKYPDYASRIATSNEKLYSGSIYSETTGGTSIAGWITAGAELIVIAVLAVVIVRKNIKKKAE